MVSRTRLGWYRLMQQGQHWVGEQLHAWPPLRHTRLAVPWVVGISAVCFLLPLVLWWLSAPPHGPIPPQRLAGVEIQQLLTALHTALAEPVLGHVSTGAPAPFLLRDVEVELHFVVQHSAPTRDDSRYWLVPVDTALEARPEHVQTLKMRLLPTLPLPSQLGTPLSSASGPRAAEEAGLHKPALPKKRERP
jgi:hypothetical protein